AAVGHGEDAVGPVGIGGALVAVGDAADRGHPRPRLHDLFLGHPPDPHAVRREAGAAVVEDGGDPAEQVAVGHAAQVVEKVIGAHAGLAGGGVVGPVGDLHRPLGRADHRDVGLVVGLAL